METIKSISIIGSGNVATHLSLALVSKGITIDSIYSKTLINANILASKVDAKGTDNLNELSKNSDLYVICVKDDAITSVITNLQISDKLIVHTSGSVPMESLNCYDNFGIFYPLQTFSKDKNVDFTPIPICIEANKKENEQALLNLGHLLSSNVKVINSEQRKALHLAAVFACNFSNTMYTIADKILSENGMSLSLLKPLIKETANKIEDSTPADVQTGPAIRNDQEVIKNHLELLADTKDYQEIYRIITDSIIKNK